MEASVVDDIINRLLDHRRVGKQIELSESEVRQLCTASKEIFLKETTLLDLQPPVKIVGDIHGQYSDLLRVFEIGGFPPESNYLFLGNYVDYGRQSLETIWLLLAYKIKYPENLFLLRGNHECASTNRIYGFYYECRRRFNIRLWKTFNDCFNCLPIAALIDDKIFCMHGGLSPHLRHLDQIRHIERPTDVPDSGLLCDLLWSEPDGARSGWSKYNSCGISLTFGPDEVAEFVCNNDLDLICRGHQVVEDGYEFFADRQLVTVFSAPNYRGEYDNAGAIMSVDESLMCSFKILKHVERRNKFEDVEPVAKAFERMNISDIGSSDVTRVNPSKSSTSTSKLIRSNSPGFKVGETSRTESESKPTINPSKFDPSTLYRSKSPGVKAPSNGSSNPTATTKSENSPGVTASKSKAASKNTSVSPAYMPANSNIGSKTVTFNPESSQEGRSRPFDVDPSTLYRSKSPGVKVISLFSSSSF